MTTTLSPSEAVPAAIVLLALGLALLLFGYRVFRVAIVALGGLVGFLVGEQLPGGIVVAAALAIVAALGVAIFYKAGVFVAGAIVGFLVASALAPGGVADVPAWIVPTLASLLGGIVAVLLERPAVIAATAFDGAFATWTGAWLLAPGRDPDTLLSLVAVVVIAALGATVQWRWTARRRPERT